MKTISKRAISVFLVVAIFLVSMIVFLSDYFSGHEEWLSDRRNYYNHESGGVIYDRNNVSISKIISGKYTYASETITRRALLPITGDSTRNITTDLQTQYRAKLSGYSLINGSFNAAHDKSGNDMQATISANVSTQALKQLGDNKGAVFVYNYKTGEIITMVSSPTYDPQNIPDDILTNSKYEGAFVNRCTMGSYPPGSTFKIITMAAALENLKDMDTRTFTCTGSYETSDGGTITCPHTHGKQNMKEAFANSCNGAFAELATDMGHSKLTKQAERAGFNKSFTVDSINVRKSSIDLKKATPNELGYAAIGQHTILATPYEMMITAGAVANGGTTTEPYLVESIKSTLGIPTYFQSHSSTGNMMSSTTANTLKEMMKNNVTNYYGGSSFGNLSVGGKTGTAEVDGDKKPHSWFVGFIDDENCPLAIAVVAENAGSGAGTALPIAGSILQAAYKEFVG